MTSCTFCGSPQPSESSLMAGPGVVICESCVALARSVIEAADAEVPPTGSSGTLRCSFCDRSTQDTRRLVAGPGVYICEQCVRSADNVRA